MNTLLRQRFTGYLLLQRYSERTIEAYLQAVAGLARYYGKSPDVMTGVSEMDPSKSPNPANGGRLRRPNL